MFEEEVCLHPLIRIAVLPLVAVSVLLSGTSYASEPQIINVKVKKNLGRILVSADLEDAFSDDVEEALLSGMPVTFSYSVNLHRSRSLIWDKEVRSVRIHKMVKYDSFSKEFSALEIISDDPPEPEEFERELSDIRKNNQNTLFSKEPVVLNHRNARYLSLKNLVAVQVWMGNLRNIEVGKIVEFKRDSKYYAEVKAELASNTFASAVNYILFFVSFLEFDTDWEYSTAFMMKNSGDSVNRLAGGDSRNK